MQGKVIFFNEKRFFGFIETEDQEDIFFHGNEIMAPPLPQKGDIVSFEAEEDGQGRSRAIKISHLD